MSEILDNPADIIYVSGSVLDTETVITISDELLSNVLSVNGQVGHVNINTGNFITTTDLSSYVTKTSGEFTNRPTVNGTGILLSGEVGGALTLPSTIVYTTGNQTISGLKNFATRPTVNAVPVALSGDAASSIEQLVKNDYGSTLYKGQPVYVSGSNGNNILIHLASNSGERTSSKTFGLLKQTLLNNEQGYVVTEGPLLNVDTSMAVDGDPIWLGPTGNLIYGLVNKPKAPQHLVSLGFVERAHQNQGKIFVKVQNGFEIDELHDVRIVNKQNSDIIIYNSGSGLWLNSGVNFKSFYTNDNPSGFITGVEKQTKLFDYVTGVPIYMYVGSAPFGSSQNDNVWEIYRTEIDQNGLVASNLLAQNATWTGRYFENYM